MAFDNKPPYAKNLVLQKRKSSDAPDGAKLLKITIFY